MVKSLGLLFLKNMKYLYACHFIDSVFLSSYYALAFISSISLK